MIEEGLVKIYGNTPSKISKELDVFYNPVMKLNRDISITLLKAIDDTKIRLCDPLAGSGIRSLRFCKELPASKFKELYVNDGSKDAFNSIKKNFKLNKIKSSKIIFSNSDANKFIMETGGFDYIDIDPFGSPNPYLDVAVRRVSRGGILAVTATDTAPLAGTYPKACKRKYWAKPLHNHHMHEVGLRILIRKVQLIGAQYDKALTPLFSYFSDHYFRVFFRASKAKKDVDSLLKMHGEFEGSGPMWLGPLWDKKLAASMYKIDLSDFLKVIKDESKLNIIGIHNIHKLVKGRPVKKMPKKAELIAMIKKLGYKASATHFSPESIRSNIPAKKLDKLIR